MKLWRVYFPQWLKIGGLFFCICLSAFSQEKKQSKLTEIQLDSVLEYYELSKNKSLELEDRLNNINLFLNGVQFYDTDSLIYNGLMQKTMLLGRMKKYDSAIIYSKELLNFSKQNHDVDYMGKSYIKLGIYHRNNHELTKGFNYFNEAFKVYKTVNDSVMAGRSLNFMASIQKNLGDYSGSKTTAIDGVGYLENTEDKRNLARLYHIISVANREQGNYNEALRYNKLALKTSKSKLGSLVYKNTTGNILTDQKKYGEATAIFVELLKDSLIKNNPKEYARILGNHGHTLWLKNKENTESEKFLLEALQIRNEDQDVQGLIASNIYLTKYYLDKDNSKALQYAEAAYINAKRRNSLTSIIEALGFIFKLRTASKEESEEYDRISVELRKVNQSNREIYAVTRYENDKLTTENLVLKAETAKKERQRIIYLFGSILIVLIAGSVFYMVQQRHKRQIIRNVYDAEARISKKLHDELANDVYNVMIQIQNDQSRKEVLDKLEDIYNSTRDISRENSSFNEVRDFHLELSNMLSSYSADYTKIIIKDVGEINWQSITPEKKIIVYRILQELMINMKKHSEASLVAITFKKEQKNIKITYADNGVGVDKDEIIYSSGLRNAENRIKTIGGSFIFDSEMERGFKATVHFPN